MDKWGKISKYRNIVSILLEHCLILPNLAQMFKINLKLAIEMLLKIIGRHFLGILGIFTIFEDYSPKGGQIYKIVNIFPNMLLQCPKIYQSEVCID